MKKNQTTKNKLKSSYNSNRSNIKSVNSQVVNEIKDLSVNLVINGQYFKINCGSGFQNLLWLFNYCLRLYDSNYCFKTGLIYGYLDSEGILVDQDFNTKTIRKSFENNQVVRLLSKEEYDVIFEDQKKLRKGRSNPSKNKSPEKRRL